MNSYFTYRERCPVCESQKLSNLCRLEYQANPLKEYLDKYYAPFGGVNHKYLEGAEYELDECQECGLIFQRQIPNHELLNILYEKWINPDIAHEMLKNQSRAGHYVFIATETARVLEYLGKKLNEIAFLDFGMGWGHWCLMAKAFGCDVYGTDLSEVRKDHATNLGISVVHWPELAKKRFDFINAEQVFEHLTEPVKVLEQLKKFLEPNGVIRINVPSCPDLKRRLDLGDWNAPDRTKNSLNSVAPLQHINLYTYRVLQTMGAKVGLRDVLEPNKYFQSISIKNKIKSYLRPYYERSGLIKYRKRSPKIYLTNREIN